MAHPNMDDRYLRRLLAAPGRPFLRSRSCLTPCAVRLWSGQNPIARPSVAIEVSAKHDSRTCRRLRCDLASSVWNSSEAKYLLFIHPSVPTEKGCRGAPACDGPCGESLCTAFP